MNTTFEVTEESVIISQFLLYMQVENVWPCYRFIGNDPQPLSASEVLGMKHDFIKMLKDN